MIYQLILSKNVNSKRCVPKIIFFNEKNQKISDEFWLSKFTLKDKFWHFLSACHYNYSNSPNLVILFDCNWFLAKNLSNFVSLPWKLHNRYCHTLEAFYSLTSAFSQVTNINRYITKQINLNFFLWLILLACGLHSPIGQDAQGKMGHFYLYGGWSALFNWRCSWQIHSSVH